MPATVIVGAQWSDEGKGKIVDLLAQSSDFVCRYQGGPNAGHTIVRDGETFKLHHVPSGILYGGKICVVGAGCVVDPGLLVAEGGQPRGGLIKVALGIVVLALVLLWALRRLRKGARPDLPGAPRP